MMRVMATSMLITLMRMMMSILMLYLPISDCLKICDYNNGDDVDDNDDEDNVIPVVVMMMMMLMTMMAMMMMTMPILYLPISDCLSLASSSQTFFTSSSSLFSWCLKNTRIQIQIHLKEYKYI